MADRYQRLLRQGDETGAFDPKRFPFGTDLTSPQREVMRRVVGRMLEQSSAPEALLDRRSSERKPFTNSVLATPCSADGDPHPDQSCIVVCKDLSAGGVSFVHTRAFHGSFLLVTFRMGEESTLCLRTRIRRVTPIGQGLYLIGGQFIERVSLAESGFDHEVV